MLDHLSAEADGGGVVGLLWMVSSGGICRSVVLLVLSSRISCDFSLFDILIFFYEGKNYKIVTVSDSKC